MDGSQETIFSDLSRQVIQDLAPGEAILFDDMKDEFLRNPEAFREPVRGSEADPASGLGIVIAPVLLTVIMPVVMDVLKYLAQAGIESGEKAAAAKIDAYLNPSGPGDAELSKTRIKEIRDCAITSARTCPGVSRAQAEMIADSLIGKLVQM